jgi:spermidine synthase
MEHVEIARAESPRGEVVLRERRDEHTPTVLELRVNGVFVMDTLETSTERALAHAALALVDRPRRVLVGGLGLGFTLHEVLADSRVESCVVVELEQAVVDWMRDGTIAHGPKVLADERVSIVVADVAVALQEARASAYDLVLLDVDNGPGHLVHEQNAAVYQPPFLARLRALLRPGGAVAVWAANEAPGLERDLRDTFGSCTRIAHPVRLQDREEEYLLYLARRSAGWVTSRA